MNSSELVNRTIAVRQALGSNWFILFDGHIDNTFYKAINCVVGFYGQNLLRGSEINPSPQMAAWSFLAYLFGGALRDKLINNTGLRAKDSTIERNHDDSLESITVSDLLSKQSVKLQ